MTWNIPFLIDYEEIDRGYVSFRGNPKGGKITGKGGLTCLFAKAKEDESKLWHRRLGHLNFKTIIKLMKGNLVRGTKDETGGTLKSFITRVENLMNFKVKVIRCDNKTEFKNMEMNQFCKLKGSRPNWLFDIDALTKIMKYQPVVAQSNEFSDNEFRPSNDGAKKVYEDLRKENECNDQREEDNTNNTNRVNTATPNINAASFTGVNVVGTNISIDLPADPYMSSLEDIGIFEDSHDDEDFFDAEADFHNLDSTFKVSPIPTTRIHKDHPLEQVIGNLHLAPQTKRMTNNLEEHGLVGTVVPRTGNKDL
nr:hypothetical protein [Tanacetum cinerariifolium]